LAQKLLGNAILDWNGDACITNQIYLIKHDYNQGMNYHSVKMLNK